MTEQIEVETGSDWNRFIGKHSSIFAVFVAAAVLAAAGAVYVFLWFTGNAQSTGLVPSSLGIWSMSNVVLFILHTIFWELLLIGIPAAIGAVIGWQWWKRMPDAHEYHFSGKRRRSRGASGAISPLLFVAFALKVYFDGNWNVAISTYTLNYVVGSIFTILLWIVAIFAVPAVLGLVWWIRHERNKKQV